MIKLKVSFDLEVDPAYFRYGFNRPEFKYMVKHALTHDVHDQPITEWSIKNVQIYHKEIKK